MDKKVVIGLDIYGTVLTMESIAPELERHFPQANAEAILKTWRQHQLAYTWRLNSLGVFNVYHMRLPSTVLFALLIHRC